MLEKAYSRCGSLLNGGFCVFDVSERVWAGKNDCAYLSRRNGFLKFSQKNFSRKLCSYPLSERKRWMEQ